MARLRVAEGTPLRATLPAWLARAKNLPETITGELVSQTDKAVQVQVGRSKVWLPLSQVKIDLDKPTANVVAGQDGTLAIRGDEKLLDQLVRWFGGQVIGGTFWVPAERVGVGARMRTAMSAIEANGQYAVTISAPAELRLREVEAAEVKSVKHGAVPVVPKTKTQPWAHQARAWQLAQNLEGCGLFLDMGTGKSKVVVDTVCNGPHNRVLIICPLTVVSVWPRQFATHGGEPVECIPLTGSVAKKQKTAEAAMRLPGKVALVINYESAWREPFASWALKRRWDLVVLDESHKIKAVSGKASVYCGKLGKVAAKRMCLTGTPMPHSPLDVWAQYRFMAPDVFGGSFVRFRNEYAVMGGYGGYQVTGWRDLDKLTDRVYSVAYRVTKDEVLDLPEAVHTERRFELGQEASHFYAEMEKYLATAVASGEVTAKNGLVKLLRLQQITSGYLVTDDGNEAHVSTEKQEALAEVLDDLPATEPVVVFARFVHDLDAVQAEAEKAGRRYLEISGRRKDYETWLASTGADVVGVQIQAGGVGIDLTRARYCVYYSVGYSLGDYDQSLARVHRPGQTRPVTYVHLLADGTIDDTIMSALADRRDLVESVLTTLGNAGRAKRADDNAFLMRMAINDARKMAGL